MSKKQKKKYFKILLFWCGNEENHKVKYQEKKGGSQKMIEADDKEKNEEKPKDPKDPNMRKA